MKGNNMSIISKVTSWITGFPEAEDKPEIKPKEIKVGKSKKKTKDEMTGFTKQIKKKNKKKKKGNKK